MDGLLLRTIAVSLSWVLPFYNLQLFPLLYGQFSTTSGEHPSTSKSDLVELQAADRTRYSR